MKINITNTRPIGTAFKAENIVLGTVVKNGAKFITTEDYDIFYKDENGYTCFGDKVETFKGDDSDGCGIIKNVVPAFDFFKEDEIVEAEVNGKDWIIAASDIEPLYAYNRQYNLKKPEKGIIKFPNLFNR